MFNTYHQNNSGGDFDIDDDRGITHFVVVEGTSSEDCDSRAERTGLYFDGQGDCKCCGDRWSNGSDCTDVPMYYDKPINLDIRPFNDDNNYWKEKNCWVHYMDGTKLKVVIPR